VRTASLRTGGERNRWAATEGGPPTQPM